VKYSAVFLSLALILLTFSPARAQEEPNLLSLGIGYYDINDNEDAVDFRAEYRWGDDFFWQVKPWIGIEGSSDGAVYGLGGLLLDLEVANKFLITPSFGAGLYHDGDGKDLGHTIEFRSQIELGYKFENQSRVGLAFGHISNAALADRNPGTEILNLYYHMPVGSLF
jgi:hypothetical protein